MGAQHPSGQKSRLKIKKAGVAVQKQGFSPRRCAPGRHWRNTSVNREMPGIADRKLANEARHDFREFPKTSDWQ
jgi:hypothetical protein